MRGVAVGADRLKPVVHFLARQFIAVLDAQQRRLQQRGHREIGARGAIGEAMLHTRGRAGFGRDAHRHAAVIDPPVGPVSRKAGGLEARIAVHCGRHDRRERLVMVQHSGNRALHGGRKRAAGDIVCKHVAAVRAGETEVEVQAAAALLGKRLGQEREQVAALVEHFARHLAEQERIVRCLHRIGKAQREFELRGIIFGIDGFDGNAAGRRRGPYFLDQARRIGKRTGAVNERAGRFIGHPAAVRSALENVGFHFDPDHRIEPAGAPRLDRAGQRRAAAQRERFVLEAQGTERNVRVRLPRGAQIGGIEGYFHVGQAGQQPAAGRGHQRLVIGHGKRADAHARVALGRLAHRHIFAAREIELVGEQDAAAFEALSPHCVRLDLGHTVHLSPPQRAVTRTGRCFMP